MQIQGIRKEMEALKKEYAPNFKTIEELLKVSNKEMHKLTDYELYRLIRYQTPNLKAEPELTEDEFKNLSNVEVLKIINCVYDEPAAN
jgi:hypothetical protein